MKKISNLIFLRTMGVIAAIVGATGSLGLMFNAGRNQKSILLVSLFTIWVLSPFIVLLVLNRISRRWPILARATLYYLMLLITVGSLVGYSGVLAPPETKPAFIYLVVPLVSWLLIVTVIPIARKIFNKGSDTNQP